LRVAVIGAGVAGISISYLLQRQHDVSLFEREDRLGGHTHTIEIPSGPDEGTPVDTGFIVFNDRTYPHFLKFLQQLGVSARNSDMSFSFYCEKTGFQYAGTNLNGIFAKRSNFFKKDFLKMLTEVVNFNRRGLKYLQRDRKDSVTLRSLLETYQYSSYFIDHYILPLGSAIWSTSLTEMLSFPAETFLRFFQNHGLLSLFDRPQWKTVVGGSHSYLKAFLRQFSGKVFLNSKIERVMRSNEKVELVMQTGHRMTFDHIVLATHADEVLPLLAAPSAAEGECFSAWTYQQNRVVLHTDISVMPSLRRAWASWNYVRERGCEQEPERGVSMSYHMNRLQGLKTHDDYCVSLNRRSKVDDRLIIRELSYTHPTYTVRSLATQEKIRNLNGQNRTSFCGSYLGYGFHEDAIRSSCEAAAKFGIAL